MALGGVNANYGPRSGGSGTSGRGDGGMLPRAVLELAEVVQEQLEDRSSDTGTGQTVALACNLA